jgi:3-oxoacyl-[acyl-carrier-protein] synthase-3
MMRERSEDLQGISIVSTGRALPQKIVTNDDLSKIVDTSDEWIQTRTGIRQRYICEEESCNTLAIAAANEAVEKAEAVCERFDRNDIGVVLVATTTGDNAFPSTACMVSKALSLQEEVMAFDISAACTGFLYGLQICRSLLMSGKKKYALLIGSEQMSKITDFTDRSTCVLFGDGAGAAVLELDHSFKSIFIHHAWSDGNDTALGCKSGNACIQMNGRDVFKFAVKVIQNGIEQVLRDAGHGMGDIDYVICHQANARIIEHVKKKYPEYGDKFYINIDRYANTSAASIPIALDEMIEQNKLKKGMKIICVGFGAGLTWSSALFTV